MATERGLFGNRDAGGRGWPKKRAFGYAIERYLRILFRIDGGELRECDACVDDGDRVIRIRGDLDPAQQRAAWRKIRRMMASKS